VRTDARLALCIVMSDTEAITDARWAIGHSRITQILQSELAESERQTLVADRERWKSLGTGRHLDDYLQFITGLMIRRRLAMRMAHTNRPIGSSTTKRSTSCCNTTASSTRRSRR
jgi:hypothetical protein